MGIPGRSETAYLVDLDFECDGKPLWPHSYKSPQGPILFPDPDETGMQFLDESTNKRTGPTWQWPLSGGKLKFQIEPSETGGICLRWSWASKSKKPIPLRIRTFWGMRDLHSLQGQIWNWIDQQETAGTGRVDITSRDGRSAYCYLTGDWKWISDPCWYKDFHYVEEIERGYPGVENLFSAGWTEIQLKSGESFEWLIVEDPGDLPHDLEITNRSKKNVKNESKKKKSFVRSAISDFTLTRPAGVVAGYPWFGEWGRDTFVSLPGITAELLREEKEPERVWDWAREVLHRWGNWIEETGMLPNVIEKDGECQWQSADATLWWCHSLASLWSLSLASASGSSPLSGIQEEFGSLLSHAINAIKNNQHTFLKCRSDLLLEVTASHATWMDARIGGRAVTPRQGLLPEINALWFQANCLNALWAGVEAHDELWNMGKSVLLQCREPERSNTVFLHSLPLAPSFVLNDRESLERDLIEIATDFWTPVGLRTLRPSNPQFRVHCVGSQEQRDLSYHQGLVWGWLGGHFEMARHRYISPGDGPTRAKTNSEQLRFDHASFDKMFTIGLLKDMPIEGHIPEIFDAEPPFTPRGAPAQAWSLACLEEAKSRRRLKLDQKITKILAQRWLERSERKPRSKRQNQEGVSL
jgi:glycogen debranching enzyme